MKAAGFKDFLYPALFGVFVLVAWQLFGLPWGI